MIQQHYLSDTKLTTSPLPRNTLQTTPTQPKMFLPRRTIHHVLSQGREWNIFATAMIVSYICNKFRLNSCHNQISWNRADVHFWTTNTLTGAQQCSRSHWLQNTTMCTTTHQFEASPLPQLGKHFQELVTKLLSNIIFFYPNPASSNACRSLHVVSPRRGPRLVAEAPSNRGCFPLIE